MPLLYLERAVYASPQYDDCQLKIAALDGPVGACISLNADGATFRDKQKGRGKMKSEARKKTE